MVNQRFVVYCCNLRDVSSTLLSWSVAQTQSRQTKRPKKSFHFIPRASVGAASGLSLCTLHCTRSQRLARSPKTLPVWISNEFEPLCWKCCWVVKRPWQQRWGKAAAGHFSKRNNSLGALQKLCEKVIFELREEFLWGSYPPGSRCSNENVTVTQTAD